MNRVTPQIRGFALRLMTHETKGNKFSETTMIESFQIFEKLHPPLASLMGNGGFRALLTRALTLAKAEVPWLSMVRVSADGTLEVAGGFGAHVTPEELVGGSSVLLAQLFGLMVAFIGEKLTLGLLREVWPNIKISDSEFVGAEEGKGKGKGTYENS